MDDLLYKVMFEGDIIPGKEQSVVQGEMAKLFGVETGKVGRLFTGKQRKLKSGLTLDQAKKYVRALAKLGALAFIEPHEEEDKKPIEVKDPDSQFTHTGSFDVSAFRAYFEKQEAEKNQPETDHEFLDLDHIDISRGDGFNTQDEVYSKEEQEATEEPDTAEPDTAEQADTVEEKTVRHEPVQTEQDETTEWDEKSGIQNVISSEILKKLIEDEKKK